MKSINSEAEFLMQPPPIPMPIIGYRYQINGAVYECYEAHSEAAYGNNPLTITAVYRKIEGDEDGETD